MAAEPEGGGPEGHSAAPWGATDLAAASHAAAADEAGPFTPGSEGGAAGEGLPQSIAELGLSSGELLQIQWAG